MPESPAPGDPRSDVNTSRPEVVRRLHWDWYLLPALVAALLFAAILFWFTDQDWLAPGPMQVVVLWVMVRHAVPQAQDYTTVGKRGSGRTRLFGCLAVYLLGALAGMGAYALLRGSREPHEFAWPEAALLGWEILWTGLGFLVLRRLDRRRRR